MVHLMLHIWQAHFGSPGRGGYHNREFANMAKTLGLHPSDTGEPGGKETGERISHFVVEGGRFHALVLDMEARGVGLNWKEIEDKDTTGPMIDGVDASSEDKGKSGKRVRYICPEIHDEESNDQLKIWGHEGIDVLCPRHGTLFIPG